jgi:hypothetical protein
MDSREVEQVLANWIAQANSSPGQLAEGIDPARWVAQQFLRWWQPQVADELASADSAVSGAWHELQRLGGWSNPDLGEALHELVHAQEALATLRTMLALDRDQP